MADDKELSKPTPASVGHWHGKEADDFLSRQRASVAVEAEDYTELVGMLRNRAKHAREEGTGTAIGDAWHFEKAANVIAELSKPTPVEAGLREAVYRIVRGFVVGSSFTERNANADEATDAILAALSETQPSKEGER